MHETEPKVYLVCRPDVDWNAMHDYLSDIGGIEWWDRQITARRASKGAWSPAQMLVEFAGRLCYRSWKPGLNANVTKVREDSAEYFANLLQMAHGSVLEHATYTFVFQDVSRVFTHELVRHRVGVAISQESLRYVRLTELGFRVPPALSVIKDQVVNVVRELENIQRWAAEVCGLDNEGDEFGPGYTEPIPFAQKKVITSALRRIAPIGLSTTIMWSANVRTLRHVLASRTAPGAEEEIRLVFDEVGHIMQQECPLLFEDFERTDDGAWVPSNPVAGQTRV